MSSTYIAVLNGYVNDLEEYEQNTIIQEAIRISQPSLMRSKSDTQTTNAAPTAVAPSIKFHDQSTHFLVVKQDPLVAVLPPAPERSSSVLSSLGNNMQQQQYHHQVDSALLLSLLRHTTDLWYLPNMQREQATALLSLADAGNFIIRPSSSRDGSLALTLRGVDACYHFSILFQDGRLSVSTSSVTFSTLPELIAYYSKPGTDMNHVLKLPEFLYNCDQENLKLFTSLKEEFWANYQQLKNSAQDDSLPPSPLAPAASSAQQLSSATVDTQSVLAMYDCLWRQYQLPNMNRSVDSLKANIRMIESLQVTTTGGMGEMSPLIRPKNLPLSSSTNESSGSQLFPNSSSSSSTSPSPAVVAIGALPAVAAAASSTGGGGVGGYDNYPFHQHYQQQNHATATTLPLSSSSSLSMANNNNNNNDGGGAGGGGVKEEIYCPPWDHNFKIQRALVGMRSAATPPIVGGGEQSIQSQSTVGSTSVSKSSSSSSSSSNIINHHHHNNNNNNNNGSHCGMDENRDIIPSFAATRQVTQMIGNERIGTEISRMVIDMATDETTLFSKKISLFIKCTLESKKSNPTSVMRNVRQFLNGLRNFLLSSEKDKLQEAIARERPKLKIGEFLNVETIIECTLSRLLIRPLKDFIYRLIYDAYECMSNMSIFTKALHRAASLSPVELGVRPGINVPNNRQLSEIRKQFDDMVGASLPLKKMEYLLKAVERIYLCISTATNNNNGTVQSKMHIGAEDFLPVFVYCLARCQLFAAELEAEFMFGLLMPSILNGEAGYYLTTLQAAAEVVKTLEDHDSFNNLPSNSLKSFDLSSTTSSSSLLLSSPSASVATTAASADNNNSSNRNSNHSMASSSSTTTASIACQRGVVRVFILNDLNDCVVSKAFPLRPWSTVRELCNMIVHRVNVYNAGDYSLYHYDDGKENSLAEFDHPMQIKSSYEKLHKKPCVFIYKKTHSFIVLHEGFDRNVLIK